jgi:hypothetical protein
MGSPAPRSSRGGRSVRVLVTPILIALIVLVLYWVAKPRSRNS